ncbi:MAG: NAD(P)H-dependent oxidoreductase [Deltaproteobacteria bacterium]|nr:NAD(P)H-dependent oxidoreductase [Deltaproteobacteria bacterium]MBW2726591.1 NAD(P)H-dependent oxidoreductase [Deltaproteobacteria bacterium]
MTHGNDRARIVGFAGSARSDSFNKKLVRVALDACAALGAETTLVDLRDYALPVYDGDLEAAEGLPENAMRLKEILSAHQGFVISAPEYNGSITALLKNSLDWVSRSPEASPDLTPYQGKFAAIMAASPSPLGGLRGLRVVREVLTNIGVTVLADQVALRAAYSAFSEDGRLVEDSNQQHVVRLSKQLVEILQARVGAS